MPIVGQVFLEATDGSAAAGIGEGDRAAIQAQVVDAVIVDVPGVDESLRTACRIKERGAVVAELGAAAEAAQAQIIEASRPVGALRRMADAEDFVRIKIDQHLVAEHTVVPICEAVEVQRGPI